MEAIFKKFGYELVADKKAHGDKVMFKYFPNPDGSIRWVWPTYIREPLFLKFYNASSFKAQIFCWYVKILFFLRIQNRFFKSLKFRLVHKPVVPEGFDMFGHWALFTGTVGPNNKALIYISNPEQEPEFIKIASTVSAEKLLRKEVDSISKLQDSKVKFDFPKVLFYNDKDILKISDISQFGDRETEITKSHIEAVCQLKSVHSEIHKLGETEVWQNTLQLFEMVQQSNHTELPYGLIRKIKDIIAETEEQATYEFSFAHGDFTPWNMYKNNNNLSIYDWELSSDQKPLGFDLFHFVMQQAIMVDKLPWVEVKLKLDQIFAQTDELFSGVTRQKRKEYFKLYLLINCVYYLDIYSKQEKWHEQIYWQIDMWNNALTYVAHLHKSHRERLLLDVFDHLKKMKYGALKFPEISPDTLSLNSDVDICISKIDALLLKKYFKEHPSVLHIHSNTKSYMDLLFIVCKDGGFLAFDLIWQLKYKGIQLLEMESLLTKVQINDYGVKLIDPLNTSRYIGYFYALNKAQIPEKYKDPSLALRRSQVRIDKELVKFFHEGIVNRKELIKDLTLKKFNKGIYNILKNRILYVVDTFKTMINKKGFLVTFSGVDGAGKSTIISIVKEKIEKQLRKKVVVLRHRPGVLPILSAWTKGKEEAERQAANTLPRQGNNSNMVSSLVRFLYYYVDYLLGQYVIYFKYILRGYVVLYDRYYFDFINDSKRSNIQLPSKIVFLGYYLLMKPKYNFFLYAEPETILSRKQELEKQTIIDLTDKYKTLFHKLGLKDKRHKYVAIKNEDLSITVNTVFTNISSKIS